ncbi:response regulator transcription factor [Parvularcula lutaonensis]|uniref:Response regulator transcription factor n=1 Tax=Parvularcula lutaonensis TaxID=491923 RepID=A0ABV7MDS9_9PROT|nr:response regulator transcription factor [Parvularcula lutaonensis]GGY37769.1 DNA-binding response regulator [Parvularcula lutaonensis]
MRTLIIEDNPKFAVLLKDAIGRRGISAEIATTLAEASTMLETCTYEALILDLGMPDGDGAEWIKSLPATRPPVLMLTARSTLQDRVLGLDAGADDYLGKPADPDEIAARLRALARRPGTRQEPRVEHEDLVLDLNSREVLYQGTPLSIGIKEADFLEPLLKRPGRVCSRKQLEDRLYGLAEPVTPNALEAVASRLRRRLQAGGAPHRIHTVRGVGYMLTVEAP